MLKIPKKQRELRLAEVVAWKEAGKVEIRPGEDFGKGKITAEPKRGSRGLLDYVLNNKKVLDAGVSNKYADYETAPLARDARVVRTVFVLHIETKFRAFVKIQITAYGEPAENRCLFKLDLPDYKCGDRQKAIVSALRVSGLKEAKLQDLTQRNVLDFLGGL